jgi:hypothetical protein
MRHLSGTVPVRTLTKVTRAQAASHRGSPFCGSRRTGGAASSVPFSRFGPYLSYGERFTIGSRHLRSLMAEAHSFTDGETRASGSWGAMRNLAEYRRSGFVAAVSRAKSISTAATASPGSEL